jgi:hypothetical protein
MRAILPEPGWPRADNGPLHGIARRWSALPSLLNGPDALLLTAFLVLTVRLLTALPASFGVDSWLELAAGRLIWHAGIPHYETLTAIAKGKPWIDQQWLAQLVSYSLFREGGLGLLGVVNVALLVSGLGAAVTTARKLGASVRDVLIPIVFCGWLFLPATEVRTQAFAVPLFALTVYLLGVDSRRPSRRVYWTLPILVLWANLHGSASLGAGLVALRGSTLAWERRKLVLGSIGGAARPLALMLGAPASLLLTPYGLSSIAYYRSTLGNSALRHTVAEWQPVTSSLLVAAPFFLLAGAMIWSFWRFSERTTLWDRLALIALAAASVGVIRNVVFFAVAALAILPLSLSGLRGSPPRAPASVRRGLNGTVVGVAFALTALTVIMTLGRSAAKLEGAYGRATMMAAIERVMRADPDLRLAADTRYGDWVLWQAPWLAGRLAADARYELYTTAEIDQFQKMFAASGADWQQAADRYRLLLLNRSADRGSISGFLREPGARLLYADRQAVLILRSAQSTNPHPHQDYTHVLA